MKTFYWLVKREFWEHRGSFLWAPIVSAVIVLALTIMGIVTSEVFRSKAGIRFNGLDIEALTRNVDAATRDKISLALDAFMMSPSFLIALVLSVVVLFYCVNTLSEDRRDRSILFWQSLPISDRNTVLAKVFAAGVVAPGIATLVGLVAGFAMLLLISVVAAIHGFGAWQVLWTFPHPFRIAASSVSLLPLCLLWALPTIGWLLTCSAWARSKSLLWALAIPLGSGVLVAWFNVMGSIGIDTLWYWRNIVARVLGGTVPGGWLYSNDVQRSLHGSTMNSDDVLNHLLAIDFSPVLTWPFLLGIAAGVALIALAIWLRRWRSEG